MVTTRLWVSQLMLGQPGLEGPGYGELGSFHFLRSIPNVPFVQETNTIIIYLSDVVTAETILMLIKRPIST